MWIDARAVKGNHIGINTQNCLIFGDKRVISTIGLSVLIIVDTPDALLVCDKTQDQLVREIVKR